MTSVHPGSLQAQLGHAWDRYWNAFDEDDVWQIWRVVDAFVTVASPYLMDHGKGDLRNQARALRRKARLPDEENGDAVWDDAQDIIQACLQPLYRAKLYGYEGAGLVDAGELSAP